MGGSRGSTPAWRMLLWRFEALRLGKVEEDLEVVRGSFGRWTSRLLGLFCRPMQALVMYAVEERMVSIFVDGVQVRIRRQPFHVFLCLCDRLSRDNYEFFQKRFLGDQQRVCAGFSTLTLSFGETLARAKETRLSQCWCKMIGHCPTRPAHPHN